MPQRKGYASPLGFSWEAAPDFLPHDSCLCSSIFVLCPFQGHDKLKLSFQRLSVEEALSRSFVQFSLLSLKQFKGNQHWCVIMVTMKSLSTSFQNSTTEMSLQDTQENSVNTAASLFAMYFKGHTNLRSHYAHKFNITKFVRVYSVRGNGICNILHNWTRWSLKFPSNLVFYDSLIFKSDLCKKCTDISLYLLRTNFLILHALHHQSQDGNTHLENLSTTVVDSTL